MTDRPREPILKKAYYSIGDVCELSGLKPHVLRYWETQFDELQPNKNRAGNRVYRPREVKLILLVRHLLHEEKFTIDGARRKLKEMRETGESVESLSEVSGPEVYAAIKEELRHLKRILTPPE